MEKRSVMVVDDSRTSRAIIRKVVSQLRPEWTIHEAASGDEAVAKLGEFNPDFVTMDMNMPGITGLEASRQIRQQRPGLPIALCTANIQDSIKAEAAEIGIHFVAKPVTEAGIAAAIAYFEGAQ